jgi:hypothetical protein
MVVVTFHISKITVALRAFDRGAVQSTRGIGQTKQATMRTGCVVIFDVGISFVTVVTIIFVFCHGRHG